MPFEVSTIATQLRSVLGGYLDIDLVVLFGSAVTGLVHAGSDLDIAVLPRRGTDMTLMQELQLQHFLSVATKMEVDLVRLDRANPVVKHEVVRNGAPLLERTPGAFSRFAADALLEYLDIVPLLELSRKRYLARIAARQI